MHNKLPSFFTFINTYDEEYIRKLNKKIAIIYRNYLTKYNEKLIINIKETCKKDGRKFFLSNNIKLSIKLSLDGVYLPSFYQKLNVNKVNAKKKFLVIGSAHSMREIKIKEKQGVELIFLSPLFKNSKKKSFLNVIKFNILASKTKKKIIALGGINSKNLNKLKMINSYGYAGISYFNSNTKIKV
jgi:thiamine-phosphate pyrophosphorylase